jgi:hypothetical protein
MLYRSTQCSMGWLPAMQYLHQQLLQDPLSRRDVRIGTARRAAASACRTDS